MNADAQPCHMSDERLAACAARLGHDFADISLLRQALVHCSATADKLLDNERMEFLGDAVLDLVVCEHLYRSRPEALEGELTEIKSGAVKKESIGRAARDLSLCEYLCLGRGIDQSNLPESVYANAFESVLAAIYLDAGLEAARRFVLREMDALLADLSAAPGAENFKSLLQQYVQKTGRGAPEYEVTNESGPDHEKTFQVAVRVDGAIRGRGVGATKKEAEQLAARSALENIELDTPPSV